MNIVSIFILFFVRKSFMDIQEWVYAKLGTEVLNCLYFLNCIINVFLVCYDLIWSALNMLCVPAQVIQAKNQHGN